MLYAWIVFCADDDAHVHFAFLFEGTHQRPFQWHFSPYNMIQKSLCIMWYLNYGYEGMTLHSSYSIGFFTVCPVVPWKMPDVSGMDSAVVKKGDLTRISAFLKVLIFASMIMKLPLVPESMIAKSFLFGIVGVWVQGWRLECEYYDWLITYFFECNICLHSSPL